MAVEHVVFERYGKFKDNEHYGLEQALFAGLGNGEHRTRERHQLKLRLEDVQEPREEDGNL
jgi:hypothetical protein